MPVELAIDLGSQNITIYQKGVGLVLKEPSVAIINTNKNKVELYESGYRALQEMRQSLGEKQVIYPIKEGTVVSQEVASLLLKSFISKVVPEKIFKPYIKAIVLISCGLNIAERKSVEQMLYKAGLKEIVLVESPLALYAYTGTPGLYVDVGASTTEIATVNKSGIITGYSVNIGGDLFNELFIDDVNKRYGLNIGFYTAEKFKTTIASLYKKDGNSDEIIGHDVVTLEKRVVEVTSLSFAKNMLPSLNALIDIIETVVNLAPTEMADKIISSGFFLSGGSVLMPGLEEFFRRKLQIPVVVLPDIMDAVCIGGGKLLEDVQLLESLLSVSNL